MLERISQSAVCGVMPYEARTSSCPAAVAPPWLPIAGTMNTEAPAWRTRSTAAVTTSSMRSMPRLPAARQTRIPGVTADMTGSRAAFTAARTSAYLRRIDPLMHEGPGGQALGRELGKMRPAAGLPRRDASHVEGRRVAEQAAARVGPVPFPGVHRRGLPVRGQSGAHRWIRAELPCASARTWSRVAIVVSPG